MVKSIVKTHSTLYSKVPCRDPMLSTLSSMTARTLATIATISPTSNAFPRGVSDPKITM